jgi:hypothetical protein
MVKLTGLATTNTDIGEERGACMISATTDCRLE